MDGLADGNAKLRIGLCRTDSIGDVVISLTTAGYLKSELDCEIVFICAQYTESVVRLSPYVAEVLVVSPEKPFNKFLEELKGCQLDILIHLFPTAINAKAGYAAKIPLRIGTAHRWWNWLYCNLRPSFSRRKSDLHEGQLNLKLLKCLEIETEISLNQLKWFSKLEVPELSENLKTLIDFDLSQAIILHPKSKGSARDWPLPHYESLSQLLIKEGFKVIIGGTEAEGTQIKKELPNWLSDSGVIDLTGKLSLREYIALIARSKGLVACSTGPLHLGAALGVKALGLYPGIKPMHPKRWAPLGLKAGYLVFKEGCVDCKKSTYCPCMKAIEPHQVIKAFQAL